MSKKSKSAAREYRRKAKLSRKQQARAAYEKMRDDGRNSKSKRAVIKGRRSQPLRRIAGHTMSVCGNVGCERCSGVRFSPVYFRDGVPYRMPQAMYRKWLSRQTGIHLGGMPLL